MKWFEDPAELKKRRKLVGLTQAELAARAGVKPALLANIEAGRRRLTEDIRNPIWEAIADVDSERRRMVPLKSLLGGPITERPNVELQESISDGIWSISDGLQLLRGQIGKLSARQIDARLQRLERQVEVTKAELATLQKQIEEEKRKRS